MVQVSLVQCSPLSCVGQYEFLRDTRQIWNSNRFLPTYPDLHQLGQGMDGWMALPLPLGFRAGQGH